MNRPTIADLAGAAGVSVSTVNRILGGKTPVRGETIQRVRSAAAEIGFYGLGAIETRLRDAVPHHRLGFLLQQSSRELYQIFGREIAAACHRRTDRTIEPIVEFIDELMPENIAERLSALGARCDAMSVIAADHPIVGQAIRSLREAGTPVVTYISDQSVPERAGYVGTDNWKLGRTAAWLIAQTTHGPGRIAVFIGDHRYQCQDVADASFRSYIREHAPRLTVKESRPTHEDGREAHRMLTGLLSETDDLVGVLIVGGGISGVLQALREVPEERRRSIRVVCRDIGPETRKGLAEGIITAALCHPLAATSDQLVQTMVDAIDQPGNGSILQRTVPFEIVTPESM